LLRVAGNTVMTVWDWTLTAGDVPLPFSLFHVSAVMTVSTIWVSGHVKIQHWIVIVFEPLILSWPYSFQVVLAVMVWCRRTCDAEYHSMCRR